MQNFEVSKYDPKGSSTSKRVSCNNSLCAHRNRCLGRFNNCPYMVSYVSAETSTSGILVEDVLHLTTGDSHHEIVDAYITFGWVLLYYKVINFGIFCFLFVLNSHVLSWKGIVNCQVVDRCKVVHSWMLQLLMVYLGLVWRRYLFLAFYPGKASRQIPFPCVLDMMELGESILVTRGVLTRRRPHLIITLHGKWWYHLLDSCYSWD